MTIRKPARRKAPAKCAPTSQCPEPATVEPIASERPPAAEPPVLGGKLGKVVALLRQSEGATLEAMTTATGWQVHSVRGAMAGALKKRGFTVTSLKTDGVRVYRLPGAEPSEPIGIEAVVSSEPQP